MIINTEKKIVESDNRLYALKDNKGLLAARPSHNRADLYKKAKILESRTNKKYIVEEYKDFVETSSISESILDKDRKINEPVYRRYYMDGKEVDRDTFYDTIIMTDVTDQQMIELENNKNRNNPVEIDGVKYFIDQSERDDEIEEEEKEEDNNLSAYTDIKKMEESSVPLKESVEDGIYNIVIYKHDLSGFFETMEEAIDIIRNGYHFDGLKRESEAVGIKYGKYYPYMNIPTIVDHSLVSSVGVDPKEFNEEQLIMKGKENEKDEN